MAQHYHASIMLCLAFLCLMASVRHCGRQCIHGARLSGDYLLFGSVQNCGIDAASVTSGKLASCNFHHSRKPLSTIYSAN
ncbi:hypothetical protein BDD12DRAFT_372744 [Trichophaea hybrida]|nr:hypothetical protein BDD12DRAFT_372744 [Trichophaea hybrida]